MNGLVVLAGVAALIVLLVWPRYGLVALGRRLRELTRKERVEDCAQVPSPLRVLGLERDARRHGRRAADPAEPGCGLDLQSGSCGPGQHAHRRAGSDGCGPPRGVARDSDPSLVGVLLRRSLRPGRDVVARRGRPPRTHDGAGTSRTAGSQSGLSSFRSARHSDSHGEWRSAVGSRASLDQPGSRGPRGSSTSRMSRKRRTSSWWLRASRSVRPSESWTGPRRRSAWKSTARNRCSRPRGGECDDRAARKNARRVGQLGAVVALVAGRVGPGRGIPGGLPRNAASPAARSGLGVGDHRPGRTAEQRRRPHGLSYSRCSDGSAERSGQPGSDRKAGPEVNEA